VKLQNSGIISIEYGRSWIYMYDNEVSKEHKSFLQKIKRRKKIILITQISIFVFGLIFWETAARLSLIDTFLTSSPSNI